MKEKKMFLLIGLIAAMTITGFGIGKNMVSADEGTKIRTDINEPASKFAGTWYLTDDTDLDELDNAFPDVFAFGCEMEIMPDGRINWHVGARGAAGTYEEYGNQLTARVSDIMENDEYTVVLTMDDNGILSMKYDSVLLRWSSYY
ncbi:MAG: hypothetical protein K5886_02120 [Lachnospiraceae bacterium]|nr:hypothetical protein [Lachnospiraceae bacterium]